MTVRTTDVITARSAAPSTAAGPAAVRVENVSQVFGRGAAPVLDGVDLTVAPGEFVCLLGAVPSIANGLLTGMKQVPPLFDRVGRVLGLSAVGRVRHVLLPAALPGYLGGLRQGWAFAWRSLMAAELITYSPKLGQGLGQLLNIGRE